MRVPCSRGEAASELLAGPKFSELLAHIRLRSPNACVLLDLPPVNLTDEALLVGPRIDAFLVVASEGKTERKQLAQTLDTLPSYGCRSGCKQVQRQSHVRVLLPDTIRRDLETM